MRVREKLAFIIILFSAKLLFAFQVQPPLFEFSLKKGDTKEFTVDIINNDSPKPLNLQIRTENLIQDDEGEVSSIKENTQWGCADWITIDLPEENGYSHISIPAERDTTIKISLSVPRDTKLAGGRYGAVLIQTIPDKKSMEKSAALISYGIGVSIKVDVLGTKHVKTAEVANLYAVDALSLLEKKKTEKDKSGQKQDEENGDKDQSKEKSKKGEQSGGKNENLKKDSGKLENTEKSSEKNEEQEKIRAQAKGKIAIVAKLKNTGNIHFEMDGSVNIRDENNKIIDRFKLGKDILKSKEKEKKSKKDKKKKDEGVKVFPDGMVYIKGMTKKQLPDGTYSAYFYNHFGKIGERQYYIQFKVEDQKVTYCSQPTVKSSLQKEETSENSDLK